MSNQTEKRPKRLYFGRGRLLPLPPAPSPSLPPLKIYFLKCILLFGRHRHLHLSLFHYNFECVYQNDVKPLIGTVLTRCVQWFHAPT